MDPRNEKLAGVLINYSCKLQPGEKILIEYDGAECEELARQLVREAYKAGGRPYVNIRNARVRREIMLGAEEEQLRFLNDCSLYQMKGMDAHIQIHGEANSAELADVPAEKMALYSRMISPTEDYRCDHIKWVEIRYPNPAMAQLAGTSTDAFASFYYDVCTMDYGKMDRAMDPLKELMDRTDRVHLTGPGTDLTFSIKGIPAIKCAGELNIPDGEVYTAPVRDSMNGVISYNTPSLEQGFTFENIRFEIENGKIVKATANDTERINNMLDTDEGARYFGEFAIGVNPYILHPIKDILFDEKICGSFHLTPGMCYENAPNGNKSAIHWDLINIQRPDYGGGEIWFDDVCIRRDGVFILPELEGLNPEKLK